MTRSARPTLVALALVGLIGLLPIGAADAAGGSTCTPWTGKGTLAVRTCLSAKPSALLEQATARLQVRNRGKSARAVAASVTIGSNGDGYSARGHATVAAGSKKTVAHITKMYPITGGNLYGIGRMTSPFRWGSYTATLSY